MSICLWTAVAVLQSPARRAPCARHRAAIARMDATGPAPDEWREFRKNLIAGGIRLTTDEDGGAAAEEAPAPAASERRSVAPKNEQLLQSQNAKLFTEYMEGAWCHPSAVPEAGGLLCRLPLEAQLVGQMRRGDGAAHWGDALRGSTSRCRSPTATATATPTRARRSRRSGRRTRRTCTGWRRAS